MSTDTEKKKKNVCKEDRLPDLSFVTLMETCG